MAKYKVAHPIFSEWLCQSDDGIFYYDKDYKKAVTFQNYFKAKAAEDTTPRIRGCYNDIIKPVFMKVSK